MKYRVIKNGLHTISTTPRFNLGGMVQITAEREAGIMLVDPSMAHESFRMDIIDFND